MPSTSILKRKGFEDSSLIPPLSNRGLHEVEKPNQLGIQREIELQYLVSPELGAELRKGHTPVHITTHYFKKDCSTAREVLARAGLLGEIGDITQFNTTRLRQKIFSSGSCEYLLECKGPKERSVLGRLARPEHSWAINEELFLSLLPDASCGTVEKLRFAIPGYIFSPGGENLPIVLELDHVLKAGSPLTRLHFDMYRADIEIPCLSLVIAVRAGSTSFSRLNSEGTELSAMDRKKVKQLSYSQLAAEGPTHRIKELYQELLRPPSHKRDKLRIST